MIPKDQRDKVASKWKTRYLEIQERDKVVKEKENDLMAKEIKILASDGKIEIRQKMVKNKDGI